MKELKEKYKLKIKGMKEKLNELKVSNEAFVTENQTLKHTLEERNLQYEGIISNMQNDMIVIKNEWEKKCQEIELTSQRSFVNTFNLVFCLKKVLMFRQSKNQNISHRSTKFKGSTKCYWRSEQVNFIQNQL